MNQQQKDTLNKYAELKKDIKLLEKQAEELNQEVLDILETEEVEEVSLSIGKITLASRRTWKYSPEITQKEEDLKNEQKTAQQTGIGATYTEKSYVVFKQDK